MFNESLTYRFNISCPFMQSFNLNVRISQTPIFPDSGCRIPDCHPTINNARRQQPAGVDFSAERQSLRHSFENQRANIATVTTTTATRQGSAVRFTISIGLTPAMPARMITPPATGDIERPRPAAI